ncbi:hypothetical protein BpHYR1_002469 [Brachionus plicatilis]|uniref:Uncharacterized protein n=1 Tax=Brachionus plicatilis TaxID=10195 RepID=A0A3M7SBC7_BRAPC|nr:hypothetical protein BpHYR1_002469 [Brachionus plicatilis]
MGVRCTEDRLWLTTLLNQSKLTWTRLSTGPEPCSWNEKKSKVMHINDHGYYVYFMDDYDQHGIHSRIALEHTRSERQIERKNQFFLKQLLDMSCQKNKIISVRMNGYKKINHFDVNLVMNHY